MHNLALALAQEGHQVSGSDDHIYDPARTRLQQAGLLPEADGWDAARIHAGLDAVILGMHAFEDNPELARARELGIPVFSFPAFIYQQSKQKQRVVIAGSYGKSTVTAMVMHVLQGVGKTFDYLVGAGVPGFDQSVKLTEAAPLIIIEGDEYLASRVDPRPKFLLYEPHMVVINGIAWDHINVFPDEQTYYQQFERLLSSMPKAGDIIFQEEDKALVKMVKEHTDDDIHYLHPFSTPSYRVRDGKCQVKIAGERQAVAVYGKHNMANLAAAWEVCELLAVTPEQFREQIATFTGADNRLEMVADRADRRIIRDYAHAPEKVKATVEAAREQFSDRPLTALVELHTFSSLNPDFLPRYKGSLKAADRKLVFVDQRTWEKRRLAPITEADIRKAFGDKQLEVFQDKDELQAALSSPAQADTLLCMSSGNFSGLDFESL